MPERPSTERGAATRDRLVAAARELFGERGYEATSIDAVLARADAKRGSLYHHFDSKHDLFDAVLDRVVSESAAAGVDEARAHDDPVESLRAGAGSWLRLARDPSIQRIVLLDAPSVVGWTRWRELDEQHILGGVRRSLQRLAAEGHVPDRDVDMLANMLLASVNEAALLIARADDERDALDRGLAAVDFLLDRLFAGRAPGMRS